MSHLIKKSFQRKGNYWLAAASEALGPVLRAWAETRAGAPSAPESWRKGLLLGAGHIGDVLYRTGSLPDLARAFPQCRWFFAAPWPAREVLGGNPFLAGVVPLRDELSRLPWRELVDLIRAEEPDVVIGYDGGSYWRHLLAACAAGVPNRVGFSHKGFSSLLTRPIQMRFPTPYAWSFRDLVSQLTDRALGHDGRPQVFPAPGDEEAAAALFHRLGLEEKTPIVVCSMFSRRPYEAYAAEHYLQSLRLARHRRRFHAVFVGAAEEREALCEVVKGCGVEYSVIAGELGLRALYCFLRRCSAAFTMDSGVRHLANAAAIPVIFARSRNVQEVEAGPYCRTEEDVAPPGGSIPRRALTPAVLSFDHARAAERLVSVLG